MIEKLKETAGPWYANIVSTVISREGVVAVLLAYMIWQDGVQMNASIELREQNADDTGRLVESINTNLIQANEDRRLANEDRRLANADRNNLVDAFSKHMAALGRILEER